MSVARKGDDYEMTTKKLYVGNIPFTATTEDLVAFFEPFKITKVKFVIDRETNRFRGFAFVELESAEKAQAAIVELDGQDMQGRSIRVSEAKEREPRTDKERAFSNTPHGKRDVTNA